MKYIISFILLCLLVISIIQCTKYPIQTQANYQNLQKFNWAYLFDTTHITDEQITSKKKQTLLHIFLDSICYDKGEYSVEPNKEGRPYLYHEYANFLLYTKHELSKIEYFRTKKTLDIIHLLPYISRDSKHIESVYEHYKKDFFQIVDTSLAYRIGLDFIIDDLIFTHDTLFKNKSPKAIYKKYNFNSKLLHQETMWIIRTSPPHIGNKTIYKPFIGYEEWIYTFWYRRFIENNMDVCLKILKEMQKKYPVRKKYTWRNRWYKTLQKWKLTWDHNGYIPKNQADSIKTIMKKVGFFSEKTIPEK
ncbi:MAG: hypothetical protein MUC49_21175 [Raineya sp.]|jgi:hypothetical protein|nr:hypothetical protein [Raineya sp.]